MSYVRTLFLGAALLLLASCEFGLHVSPSDRVITFHIGPNGTEIEVEPPEPDRIVSAAQVEEIVEEKLNGDVSASAGTPEGE